MLVPARRVGDDGLGPEAEHERVAPEPVDPLGDRRIGGRPVDERPVAEHVAEAAGREVLRDPSDDVAREGVALLAPVAEEQVGVRGR